MKHATSFAAPLTLALTLSSFEGFAQTAAGEVNGTVTDKSGGAVPNANVRLTNQGTKISVQVQTNTSGRFVFINVQPGSYDLSVESAGFKKAQVPVFNISVN